MLIDTALRFAILYFLVPASVAKWRGMTRLHAAIREWRVVPKSLVKPASFSVVGVETFLMLSLAFGLGLGPGAMLGCVFFACVAIASSTVVVRGLAVRCTCFSLDGSERVSWFTVGRTALLSVAFAALASRTSLLLLPGGPITYLPVLALLPVGVTVLRRLIQPPPREPSPGRT
ncbi:MAG: hypothetical protein KC482_03035 [Dehalococcoidia bacterium]|nr:hypothetical protein [Dehalococcoidia bacterium]MCA9852562.1 hypothetical protein [Dehalococcoidia bacterium]